MHNPDPSRAERGLDRAPPVQRDRRARRSSRNGLIPHVFESRIGSLWLLSASVLGSALALGGIPTEVLLVVAGGVVAALVAALLTRGVGHRLPAPAWVMTSLGFYSLLQSVPLPARLVAAIAPMNSEVWQGALSLYKAGATALPVSLDAGASRVEALKWLTYAGAFSVAATLGARRRPEVGVGVVFLSAVVTALVTLAHRLAGATSVYGVYQPVGEFMHDSLGPLLNPNNLAGYMNLGLFGGLGLLLMGKPPLPRWLVALGVALLLAVELEAGSRGGLLALGAGLVVLSPLLWRRYMAGVVSPRVRRTMLVSVAAVIGLGALLGILALAPHAFRRSDDSSFSKLAMASWVVPMLRDYPWLGVGRGAFESAFQSYRIGHNNLIYAHAENFLVQWGAEWGVPISVLALLALAWCLRPTALGTRRSPAAIGVLAGVLVLLLQNLVDLGLEVPAVALAVCVCLGSCWGAVALEREKGHGRGGRRLPGMGSLAVALTLVLALVALGDSERVAMARYRLETLLANTDMAQPSSVNAFRAQLRQAGLAHPADPYFARLGAVVALRAKDDNPLPWLDRALEQGLTNGRTHLLLARVLGSWGKVQQALLELRFAATYDPDLASAVAQGAMSLTRDADWLFRAAPQGEAGARVLAGMARLTTAPAEDALALRLLREAMARAPYDVDAVAGLARFELAHLGSSNSEGPCAGSARQGCIDEARSHAATLVRLAPNSPAGAEVGAKLRMLLGDHAGAVAFLKQTCPKVEPARRCQLLLLEATTLTGDMKVAAALARSVASAGCHDMSDCGQLYAAVAGIFLRANERDLALAYLEQAATEDPSDARWLKVANLAADLGEHARAASALGKVQRSRGRADAALLRRIEQERLRAVLPELVKEKAGK